MPPVWSLALLLLLGGCATRPINPPIAQADPSAGYRFETPQARDPNKDNLVILAFSGGGTRAAAFSYGVLEFLRRTEVVGPQGNRVPLLGAEGFSATAAACKEVHNPFGPILPVALVALMALFGRGNRFRRLDVKWFLKAGGLFGRTMADSGYYNAGQKA